MKPLFLFLSLIFIGTSCKNKVSEPVNDVVANQMDLMEADKAFSAMSKKGGMKKAFIEYLDSNGVLLRPNQMFIIGANAIDYLIQQDDAGYSLTWEPQHAEVANSAELGYTFGIYAMRPIEKDTVIYGTYTSIWRKQKDGVWKLLLNTCNEGLGDPNQP